MTYIKLDVLKPESVDIKNNETTEITKPISAVVQ
jgi:hypothetical protein